MTTSATHLGTGAVTLGLGAALMYFLDPVQGRRRRALLRDQGAHTWVRERDFVGQARRDLANRARGAATRLRHPTPTEVPDHVVAERIRAQLGRVVGNPGSVEVSVSGGLVVLSGLVHAEEQAPLLRCVEEIPGVHEVVAALDAYPAGANVPGLQGGPVTRSAAARVGWTPAARFVASTIGVALVVRGLGRGGLAGTLAGTALLLRSVLNLPLPRILGIGEGRNLVEVQKTITIPAPVAEVFALWDRLERLPSFMTHVRRIDVDDDGRRTRWLVDGAGGVPLRFDADITALVPERLVAWRTRPGQLVEHAGVVRFEPQGGQTRLHVHMRYTPPLGAIGHTVARILGWDPKARMDDDLLRMRRLLDRPPPTHMAVTRRERDVEDPPTPPTPVLHPSAP